MKRFLPLLILFQWFLWGQDNDLLFFPDSGIRVDSSGISKVVVDTSGFYFIYYNQGPNQMLAVSEDGLNFTLVNINDYPDYRYHPMPDSSYRRYFVELENDTARLMSRSSIDGSEFELDAGYRYVFTQNDAITNSHVYATYFNNVLGEVYMIYLAGGIDNARSIHSEAGDNGWTFDSYTTDIFSDSILGGGNQSYWDPHAIVLPDSRIRIFTMNQHGHPVPPAEPKGTIYSFTSEDHGATFTKDPGYRLRFDDYMEFEVLSLNDPKVILLPDGRYRMYMASMIRTGFGEENIKWAIVSATTSTTIAVDSDYNMIPVKLWLKQNFPNPFNPMTMLQYDLPHNSLVNITIYDMLGREVKTLINQTQDAGYKSLQWNATNDYGKPVSAGIYLYQIQAGEYISTKKMVLLK